MWIPNPKVASSSMSHSLGSLANTDKLVFVFVRHPLDKLNSALAFLEPDLSREDAYHKHYNNYHVRPQAERLAPFKGYIDFVGHYETLNDDWIVIMDCLGVTPLRHLNRGNGGDWTCFDWSFVGSRFDEDYELCKLSNY